MPKASSVYSVHPGVLQMQEWILGLEEKTGRSLDGWVRLIRKQRHADERSARAWLKQEHGVGANTAWWLVERAFAKDLSLMDDDPDRYLSLAPKYVDGMYAGKKEALRPLHDRLIAVARTLGEDVKVCPCKTIVPLYRRHVFAQLKPSTNTRLDLGLCLTPLMKEGKSVPARLIDTGGFKKKDRITHRVPIGSAADIDGFVERWLGKAYELDA